MSNEPAESISAESSETFEWRGIVRNSNTPIPPSPRGRKPRDYTRATRKLSTSKSADYLIGKRFGELEVLGEAPDRIDGHLYVFVRCDCGVERAVRAASLDAGKLKSCGRASHRDQLRIEKGSQVVGQTFGFLTVVSPTAERPDPRRGVHVNVRCECGAERVARVTDLLRGAVVHCGGDVHAMTPIKPTIKRWEVHGKYMTYAAEAVGTGMLKVGRARDLEKRIKDIQSMCPVDLRVFAVCDTDIERKLHDLMHEWRAHGEWFRDTAETRAIIASEMRSHDLSTLQSLTDGRGGIGRKNNCKRCGGSGHYAKTCTNPPAQSPPTRTVTP